jgi:hypothetical protein
VIIVVSSDLDVLSMANIPASTHISLLLPPLLLLLPLLLLPTAAAAAAAAAASFSCDQCG